MTLTELLVPTYRQMLQALAGWLKKAQAQTQDADALMSARLAPDMFPLSTQIRFACRQAYEGGHRLRHETIPAEVEALQDEGRNGGEQPGTMAQALARIDETLAYLASLPDDALDGGAGKPLALELPMGIAFDLDGDIYARDWALSQFYFHVMTAYAILRHKGIALGKADYVQHMFAYLRPGTAPAG
ncbi:MAG: DUF1993 domain-containing protein [Acidobacteria bacterium]|jgi:hypothetical protein|nr:DUF1993 domain-containing protein [Acidobacteriota bacterium]